MSQKLLYEPNKAIKTPFKLFVMGVFVIFGLLFVNEAMASENFEGYNVGQNLLELEYWGTGTEAPVDYAQVISTPVYSGNRASVFNKNLTATSHQIHYYFNEGETIPVGNLSVWFRTTGTTGSVDGFWFIVGNPDNNSKISYVHFGYNIGNFGEAKYKSNFSWYLLGNYTGNTWFNIQIEWKSLENQVRYKLDNEDWTNWVATPENAITSPKRVNFGYVRWLNTKYWYVDDILIEGEEEECSTYNNWFDCEVVGCCWFYNPYLILTNYCGICYEGCSWDSCGSCENQEDCEGAGCYWTGEYCSWIVSECGSELACQFCATQETCEAKGCYWSIANQICWYKLGVLPSSWVDYYAEHGGYEEPAGFVNDLAETTGKAFDSISSIFEGLPVSFSNSDALARGTALGQVIPKSRGYLKIFDSFFGHIPIGETFVFILIFMLAIGLFRIIRHLIQLVKP